MDEPLVGALLSAALDIAARNGLSVREDLMEAVEDMGFDPDRTEWGIPVRGACGMPRVLLGSIIITLKDDGTLVVTLE